VHCQFGNMAPFNSSVVEAKVPDKLELAKQEFFNQPDGFPFEGFKLEDVNLPPDEEAAAVREVDEEAVEQDVAASQETGFGSIIGVYLRYSSAACRVRPYRHHPAHYRGLGLVWARKARWSTGRSCG
jgi:hypothetical protein